ncbi:MAG: RecX family transcriptional regulator [Myxococcota bacterium]
MNEGKRPRRRRLPGTEAALHEMALGYLERFPTTTSRFRRYLSRKVSDAVGDGRCSAQASQGWTEAVIERLTRAGLLDDVAYAASRARVLHQRGRSLRFIQQDLRGRGVSAELVEAALASLEAEHTGDLELSAALRHARRRRLGPFDTTGRRTERRRNHLAALARAGFSFDIAKTVVDAPDEGALHALAEQA